MPTCSPDFLFFIQLDLVRDLLKRADLFSSGFLFFVELDLVHDYLKRADLLSLGLSLSFSSILCADRLKRFVQPDSRLFPSLFRDVPV